MRDAFRGGKAGSASDLSEEHIRAAGAGSFWRELLLYDKVDSTNDVAAALSKQKQGCSRIVVIADAQERGKGRRGRRWASPGGLNIFLSILLEVEMRPDEATALTMLAAVSSVRAIEARCGLQVRLKWPNDLMVAEKKIGGILTETRSRQGKISLAVIGIGINVNSRGEDLPGEIRFSATSLREEKGTVYSRSEIIGGILREFELLYRAFSQDGKKTLIPEVRRLSSTLGKEVVVTTEGETLPGFAEDIDEEGMLILRASTGETRRISAGEVASLRQ